MPTIQKSSPRKAAPPPKPPHSFPSNGQFRLTRHIRIRQHTFSPNLFLFRGKLNTFEIIWPIDGQLECMHTLVATPNRPVLLIPGRIYIFQTQGQLTRAIIIQFNIDRYPRSWKIPSMWPNYCNLPDADICRPLLNFLLTHAPSHDPILIRPALTMLIVAIVTNNPGYNMPPAPAFPPVLTNALAAIRARLHAQPYERIRPEDLAKEIGCCRGVIDKYFKRFLHHTPAEEIMLARLDRAVFMLARMDFPIDVTAALTGFCSNSLLFLHCRKHFACSPSVLRDHLREGKAPYPMPLSPLLYEPFASTFPPDIPLDSLPYPPGKHTKDYRERKKTIASPQACV